MCLRPLMLCERYADHDGNVSPYGALATGFEYPATTRLQSRYLISALILRKIPEMPPTFFRRTFWN